MLATSQVFAKIMVIKPEDLAKDLTDIQYNLSKFGEIDYRSQEIYEVQMASEEEGCSFLDSVKRTHHKVALLMIRGNCTFSKKASNASQVS